MNTDKEGKEFSIQEVFQDGIYFWGVTDYVKCLKQPGKWVVTYHRCINMCEEWGSAGLFQRS